MNDSHDDGLMVHLTVDDARTVQEAGAKFARDLACAMPRDFLLALSEQQSLIQRAITDAGFTPEQARLADGHFEVAAREEWAQVGTANVCPMRLQ